MATTTTGAADDGDDTPLTPEQREALRRAVSNPALMEALKRAAPTLAAFNRQALISVAPALERLREQQRQMAQSIAPLISRQVQMSNILAPIADQVAASQRNLAKQLSLNLNSLVVNPAELAEAFERISRIASVGLTMPTDDGLARLADLIDAGEIDEDALDYAEESVAANTELSESIDDAAEMLSRTRPFISRRRARQIIVFLVWFAWTAGLVTIAVIAPSEIAAIPGAAGIAAGSAAAKRAGREFDKRYPPEDEGEDKPEE